jgi:glycosyltransferase involved in cell wall biosynthesis
MLHAYPPYHNGGAEMTAKAIFDALVERGHTVDVLLNRDPTESLPGSPKANSYRTPKDYVIDGVNVFVPVNNGDPFRWINTDRHPDVIVTHLENTTRAAVLGDMHDITVVHLLHNTTDFSKHCLRRGRTDLAIFNTAWMRDDYATWFSNLGLDLPPSIVVHPAVWREDYEGNRGGNAITLVNLFEPKGGPLFWELARRLPNRRFLGVIGAYGEQVIEGPLDNVELMPHQKPEAMSSVYAKTKVLLMPSSYESYGRVAVEAACSGIPTIAHPTPGLREALGEDGIFVDREDVEGWIAALRRLWTPKGYAVSRANALAVAARQTPAKDLAYTCDAIEGVTHGFFAPSG